MPDLFKGVKIAYHNDKSFKDLDEMTTVVAEKFFLARKLHQMKDGCIIAEKAFDENLPYDAFLLRVQEAFEGLTEKERNLINNEFFFQGYQEWWKSIYSKATFYRFKKETMAKFLGAFYRA